MKTVIRIGSRESRLAVTQTELIKGQIEVDRVVRHVFISINISAMHIFHDFVSFLTRNTRTGSFLQTAG